MRAGTDISGRLRKRTRMLHERLTFHNNRLAVLALLPHRAVGAEVGVLKGNNAATILRTARPAKLYLIDPWHHQAELENALYGGRAGSQATMDEMCDSVRARFAGQIERGQVVVLRMASTEASEQLGENSLDFVYLDGDHRYEGVLSDLQHFARCVRPGGLITGDDYSESRWWGTGVKQAVDEFVTEHSLELVTHGSQFAIRMSER